MKEKDDGKIKFVNGLFLNGLFQLSEYVELYPYKSFSVFVSVELFILFIKFVEKISTKGIVVKKYFCFEKFEK